MIFQKQLIKAKQLVSLWQTFRNASINCQKHWLVTVWKKRYSSQGEVLIWINNWLNGRKQREILNGEVSDWTEVLSGCVQGSILGPLIALCLLDKVDDHLSFCKVSKYADDDKFYASIKSVPDYENMQGDINKIVKWADE